MFPRTVAGTRSARATPRLTTSWRALSATAIPDLRAGDDRRYEMAYIEPGDTVYAYGTAELDNSLSGEQSKPLVLTGRDGLFFLSDQDPLYLA